MPEPLPVTHDTLKMPHPPAVEPFEVTPAVEDIDVLNDDVIVEIAPDRPSWDDSSEVGFRWTECAPPGG